MVLNIKKKKYIILQIQEHFKTAVSVVVASLKGVQVNAINQLRKEARRLGVYIKVVPNTLLHRATTDTPYACLSHILVGQSVVAFSTQKANDAARIFVNFSKENLNFKIKGAVFEGNFINSDQVDLLSNLPDYQGSILRLISVLQMSSIGNLIGILQRLSSKNV